VKSLLVEINGKRHCIAGLESGNFGATVSWDQDSPDTPGFLSIIGLSQDRQTAIWPAAILRLDDEVRIRIVDTDAADPPMTRDELIAQEDVLAGR
jgi:hypothetical protein